MSTNAPKQGTADDQQLLEQAAEALGLKGYWLTVPNEPVGRKVG